MATPTQGKWHLNASFSGIDNASVGLGQVVQVTGAVSQALAQIESSTSSGVELRRRRHHPPAM